MIKPIYNCKNANLQLAETLWPEHKGDGVQILYCDRLDGDDWVPVRTSLVEKIEGNDVHTMNSIYRIVDGSL